MAWPAEADREEGGDRVLRVEWRRHRYANSLVSHSFLTAHVSDGWVWRFEVFSDVGYRETQTLADRLDGEVYDGRVATEDTLVRPLMEEELCEIARAAGSQTYSLDTRNCHHFVREVWNAVVSKRLQQVHYPDRIKVHILRTLPWRPFEQLLVSVGSGVPGSQANPNENFWAGLHLRSCSQSSSV